MSEELRSTIQLRTVDKGRKKQFFIMQKTNNGEQLCVINETMLSPELKRIWTGKMDDLVGIEVQYVKNSKGQVSLIWRVGEPHPQSSQAQQAGPAGAARAGTEKFENPYNFIPAPRRNTNDADLGDSAPCGHHAYLADRWSGRLSVKITVATPLLIPDASRAPTTQQGHKIFETRCDAHGAPLIPTTTVKGMLRSVFEAATNSRFGALDKHENPLGLRLPSNDGGAVVPVRIGEDGKTAQLLTGTSRIGGGGAPAGPLYAAWIPAYRDQHFLRSGRELLRHGQRVWAEIELWNHRSNRFKFWRVVRMRPYDSAPRPTDLVSATQVKSGSMPDAGTPRQWVEGWVFVSNRNMNNKHDERLFFVDGAAETVQIPVEVKQRWTALISNYQEIHKEEIAAGITRPSALNNPSCEWSRHVNPRQFAESEKKLEPGTLCYAKVEKEKDVGWRVVDLYPVTISRGLYRDAPNVLIDSSLMPAKDRSQLSPAERVFGWVSNYHNGKEAWRGQLSVGPVVCTTGPAAIEPIEDDNGLALAILGQPKPAQARFYIGSEKNGNVQKLSAGAGTSKVEAFYVKEEGQTLRGRKVYPHHALTVGAPGYWSARGSGTEAVRANDGQTLYREYRYAGDKPRSNQNRSTKSWIKPGAEFIFDIDVTNLSEVELGALLWLLRWPADHCHRLGGGKPLGFGSVRLELQGVALRSGQQLAQRYRDLSGGADSAITQCDDAAIARLESAFKEAVCRAYGSRSFDGVPFVKALINAAPGGGLPVHYPRPDAQRTDATAIYEWFVNNEKLKNNDPMSSKRFQSLPELNSANRGLGYLPTDDTKEQSQNERYGDRGRGSNRMQRGRR